MNKLFSILFFCITLFCFAQPNTEIFLFDLNTKNGVFELSNYRNISNNEGYDNQPSFLDNNTILYSGTRKGQTDIVKYNIRYDSKIFINHTDGSEYSPLKIPSQKAVSAIRLEKNGDQKLYKYSLRNGESEVLVEDIIIGYHVWNNEDVLVSSVLEDNKLALYTTKFKEGENKKFHSNIGRSLHKIPESNLISFISKTNSEVWEIQSIHPSSGKIKSIVATFPKSEDMCWTPSGTIVMGHENKLYTYTPNKDKDWKEVSSLESYGIKNITRLAISPDGSKIAIVGEGGKTKKSNKKEEPKSNNVTEIENIVQTQLDAYNNRDLDAFMATYSNDIKLYNYPNKLTTDGHEQMKKGYKNWFDNTPDLRAFIKKRIVIGNKVIDHEQVTANGKIFNAVAIYEVENGKINKVTFIRE